MNKRSVTLLEPGAEIEITLDKESFARTVISLEQYGYDADSAEVSFSIGLVGFSDGLQWHKGHRLRVDPNNPNRWIPVTKHGIQKFREALARLFAMKVALSARCEVVFLKNSSGKN